ncbi:MAG: 23S rRNA pseudouridine(955/2504/2580) synthase RluC [Gammaproteobacteria bacterium]|nr:MAG: 23S rRNA pseudouridine(955/2504/2580) synthase RluC [Gammaproteobacteria bacterium]
MKSLRSNANYAKTLNNTGKSNKPSVQQVVISDAQSGQRLDNFLLSRLKGVPRSLVYRLVRSGEVRINKGRKRPDYRLRCGDVVRIPPVRTAVREQKALTRLGSDWLDEHIVYEDEHLLVLNKPSGMAVHGGSGISLGVIETIRQLRPQAPYLELVHRLDRETSGCLLIAKRRSALTALHTQLRERKTDKRYLALVSRPWKGKARRVEAALTKNQTRSGERIARVSEAGSEAISRFVPKTVYAESTLVEIELKTGRTHQARVHAAHINHPIAGDEKYGDKGFNRALRNLGLKRLFLHAASITIEHPKTNQKIKLEAALPDELQMVLSQLAK